MHNYKSSLLLEHCGIKQSIIKKIQEKLTQFPEIKHVVLYGSRAIGHYKIGSDIDLTIDLNAPYLPSIMLLNKISLALDALDLIYTFDLSFLSDITNTNLIEHINQFGIIFYTCDEAS